MVPRQRKPSTFLPTDEIMDGLLGQGLRYLEWERSIKSQNYDWNNTVKNTMIKKEYYFFKEEIMSLREQDNEAPKGRDNPKSNSAESILRRLKGKTWIDGVPNERTGRLRSKRLLGPDAK
jgi:hypothetical protein